MQSVIDQIKSSINPNVLVISLSKGLIVDKNGPKLISELISTELQIKPSNVGVLMGANLANEVAEDSFVETTIACKDPHAVAILKDLFQDECFNIQTSTDVSTVEIFGALKNVVALGIGFADGLNLGMSTKAAIIRQGVQEMVEFAQMCSKNHQYDVCTSSFLFLFP